MWSIARLLGAALLVLSAPISGLRSHSDTTGRLKVVVLLGDPPALAGGVRVQIKTLALSATTSGFGVAILSGVKPGSYVLTISLIGQCTEQRTVTLTAGGVTNLYLWLCHGEDAVVTPATPSTDLIAAVSVRTSPFVCRRDRILQGSNGVAPMGTNALRPSGIPPCPSMAWVLSPDHAPAFRNTQGDFSWTTSLGDVHLATLPDRRLRVPVRIWLADLPGYDSNERATLASVLRTTVLPNANTLLSKNYSGILLVAGEGGDALPDITDASTIAGADPAATIGKDCDHVNSIKATPSLYLDDRINVYYVAGDEVGYAGFNCFAQGAPNIVFMQAGASYYYTLLHEIGHGLGLTRPDQGHTDNLPGFFGTGDDGTPSLNLMAPHPDAPDYFSVGQVIRMHADDESWLNAPSGASGTVRSRQTPLGAALLVTRCGCPESKGAANCPPLRADIPRSGIMRTTVPSPMACYVKAPACFSLGTGSGSFDTGGFADAALSNPGSGLLEVWSLTPGIVTATLSGSTVQLTRVGNGIGQVRVSAGGSYASVQIPASPCS